MTNINEKEYLNSNPRISLTGFTEKPINRLASTRFQPNILTIETNHVKRNLKRNIKDINPLLEYQLWLEAGKMDKTLIKSINSNESLSFNSNIWRNYRSSTGLYEENKFGLKESIASLYPINIPPPSQIGSNTLKKYFEQNKKIFKSEDGFRQAMERVDKEATLMKYLRLKSEVRNPPLDYDGNILPPKNFKKYPPSNRKNNLEPAEEYCSRSYPHLSLLPTPKIQPGDSFVQADKIKIDATRIRMKHYMPLKAFNKKSNIDQITTERITGNTFRKSDVIK